MTLRDRQDNWMKTEVRRAVILGSGAGGCDVGAEGLVVIFCFLIWVLLHMLAKIH